MAIFMTPCSLSVKRKRRRSITMPPGGGREDPFVFKYFLTITAAAIAETGEACSEYIACMHLHPPSPPPPIPTFSASSGGYEREWGREGRSKGREEVVMNRICILSYSCYILKLTFPSGFNS